MYLENFSFYPCPGTDPTVGNKTVQRAKFSILRVYIPMGANQQKQANIFLMQPSVMETNENKQQRVANSLWKFKEDATISR